MAKRVLVVNGSGRKNSNSRLLGARVAAGAEESGHTVETVDIGGLDIKPCSGCEACIGPEAKGCVVRDDMRDLYPRVVAADVIVLASPIYWFTLPGQIKQFIDRLFAVAVNPGPDGKSPFAAKKIAAAFTYGDADPMESGCVNAVRALQDICAYTGSAWAGAVYGTAKDQGEIQGSVELLEKAKAFGANL